MNNKLKKIFCLTLILFFSLSFSVGTVSASDEYDLSGIPDAGIYITELNSGEVLISQNCEERMYPGSITKIMTVMVTLDNLSDLNEKVTVTEEALSYLGYNSSVAGLEVGEILTVEDLIKGTLVPSGNDAAIVLGIFTGGKLCNSSDEAECYKAFIAKMNEKASFIGMRNTHFNNADGYDDYENYSTAYDIVIMGKVAARYEVIKNIVSKQQVIVNTNKSEHIWKSTNLFYYSTLSDYYGGGENPYQSDYVTGMKTGYTDIGQKCFLFTAQADGMELVGAVLNIDDSDSMRIWKNTYNMLDYIINEHTLTKLITDENCFYEIKVSNPSYMKSSTFTVYAANEGLSCVYNEYLENMQTRIEYNAEICTLKENGKIKLSRDIKPMDKVASLIFYSGNDVFYEIDLIATEAYAKFDGFDLALYIITAGFVYVLTITISKIFKKPKRKRKYAR